MRWYNTSVRLLLVSLIALAIVASTPAAAAAWQPGGGGAARPAKTTWSVSDAAGQPAVVSALPVPTNLTVVDQFNSRDVVVSWTNAADAPGEVLVERQRHVAGTWTEFGQAKVIGAGGTLTDTPGPGRYRYRVASHAAQGRSAFTGWKAVSVVQLPAGVQPGLWSRDPARPVGMNLEGVEYYTRGLPFRNLMRMSAPWVTQYITPPASGPNPYDTGAFAVMPKDADNYPLQIPFTTPTDSNPQRVGTLMLRDLDGRQPTGRYVMLFDGDGDIAFTLDARAVSTTPGRITFDIRSGSGGIGFNITRSTFGNHIRNIRIYPQSEEGNSATFSSEFINAIKPYQVLRFMDWQRTNNSQQRTWADRPRRSQLFAGPTLEDIIELCNLVHADPWVCTPHLADDDYVRQMARLLRDTLEPERKIYIERSNEVWNGIFQQASHAAARGSALGLAGTGFDRQVRFHAKDSARVFRIFTQEFGGNDRLCRVLGSQAANTGVSTIMLSWFRDQERDVQADTLAIAPYYGNARGSPENAAATIALGLDGLFDAMNAELQISREWTTTQKAIADEFGVNLTAYECGMHLVGYLGAENNQQLTDLFLAFNREPRIYGVTRQYHEEWWAAGGGLACAFSHTTRPTKWGAWGYLEYINQPLTDAHKARALHDAARLTRPTR